MIPIPTDDSERLRRLRELNVLDSQREPLFDTLVRNAARACDCPIALISLLDQHRQWFKANVGLEAITQTPIDQAICLHTLDSPSILEVPDLRLDQRFSDYPLVCGDESIKFYAGAPLVMPDGTQVGTLCVLDRQVRKLNSAQLGELRDLAAAVTAGLILRRDGQLRQATTALAQERLDWLFRATPAMMQSIDNQGRIILVSDTWLRRLGYRREDVIGHDCTEFLSPESAEYITTLVKPAFFGVGRCDDIELQMLRGDGRLLDVKMSATLERDGQGEPLWSVTVIQDVSAQKRAEQRLTRSRDRLSSILDGTNVGTWEWNVKTGEVRFNERWAQIHGYTLAELEPVSFDTWTSRCDPGDLAESMKRIEAHLRGDTDHYDYETRMRHRDGHWIWAHDRGRVAEWDRDGNPVWMMGTHADITDRKLSEEALYGHKRSLEYTGQIAKVGGWSYEIGAENVDWSEQTCRIFDLAPDSLVSADRSLNYFDPTAREIAIQAFNQAITSFKPWDLELPATTASGRSIWVHVVGEPVAEAGRTVRLVGAIQDITRHRDAERELAESRELLEVTLESIGDAVITTDLDGLVQWLNPVAERLTGWSNAEAFEQELETVFQIVDEDQRKPASNPVHRCLDEGKLESLTDNSILIARNGTEYAIKDSASPIRDRDGDALGVVLVFHDESEQRQMTREMGYRATHDTLTGLCNRSEFESRLAQVLEHAQRQPRANALMYIDLDQFKIVNDSCGHGIGDLLLQQVSTIMSNCIRTRDTLARLGGDEFGVILEHCTVEQAERVAQKICDDVSEFRLLHEGKPYRVGTSIGLVPISDARATVASVLQAADSACYAAKEGGRSRVHTWRETDRLIQERQGEMQWASRIEQALDEDRFVLYAQRIVPLNTAPVGLHCEVLVRIKDDDGSLISPGAFLPAAERYHLASRVDRWVVRNTFAWLEHPDLDPRSIDTVSINLSGQSIGDQVFHRFLTDLIAEAKFDVGCLCLEITETAAITRIADASRFIGEMRELGIRIALDDFGAGASSFGYLKSLPVHFLKIDGQFVRGVTTDPLDLAAVRCFTEVARVVGIKTVAEFVENQDEVAKLAELGVDYGQGYLLHKPEPLANLLRLPVDSKLDLASTVTSRVA